MNKNVFGLTEVRVTPSQLMMSRGVSGRFTAEASELELPPGQWPETMLVVVEPFAAFGEQHNGGELMLYRCQLDETGAIYSNADGSYMVQIFND